MLARPTDTMVPSGSQAAYLSGLGRGSTDPATSAGTLMGASIPGTVITARYRASVSGVILAAIWIALRVDSAATRCVTAGERIVMLENTNTPADRTAHRKQSSLVSVTQ